MSINAFTVLASLFVFSINHSFLYVYCQSVPYVVEIWDVSMSNNSHHMETEVTDESNCTQALEVFTEAVTNLTRCILLNASPIRVCSHCEENINATDEAYDKLQQDSSCKFYFESDQAGIVNVVYGQGKNIWSTNNCQNCYDHFNDTQEFFKVSEDLDFCMKQFNESTGVNSTCSMCQQSFIKMNNIYKEFVKRITDNESGGVCTDITDQMNITRHLWSSRHCLRFDANIGYPNIITAVLVGIIPILFYLLSKNVSIIEDVKLVRPKRKNNTSLHDSLQTL